MIIPKLSQEALAAIGETKPIASATDPDRHCELLLARARSMSAGLRLVLVEIDAIGVSLKGGIITPERAARDLAALERVPCYTASIFYAGRDV
jgi:hypothetical protein